MTVALMITCLNDAMFPETGQAVVRLFRRLGSTSSSPARVPDSPVTSTR